MPFLIKDKTNWGYILVVIISAVVVSGMVWYYYVKDLRETHLNEFSIKENKTRKIIAFDVSHNNLNDNYSKFLDNFREVGFEVKFITNEINEETLKNVDTLIITTHYSTYLSRELKAINEFLKRGGNLLVLGDLIGLYDINRVISPLGAELSNCSLLAWQVFLSPYSNNILIKDVNRLSWFPVPACIKLKNDDFKTIVHASEWSLLVVKENKNKILISGDSNFCNDLYIKWSSNPVFCKNIALWFKQSPEKQNLLPEVKIDQKEHSISQKIILTSDKTEYERRDEIKFTILNDSSDDAYFPSGREIQLTFQKYNSQKGIWENVVEKELRIRDYPIRIREFNIGGLNRENFDGILGPGEKIITGDVDLTGIVEQIVFIPEKYRAVISYYKDEKCRGSFFRDNQEFCDARKNQVFSNEFLIKETILPEGAIEPAVDFCRNKNKLYFYDKAFFLNFDNDLDKEIIGICGLYGSPRLFVLDKRSNKYESVLEKVCIRDQNFKGCLDLEIKDLDKDGIDEIIYKDIGGGAGSSGFYLNLYSPKYNEWFYRLDWQENAGDRDEKRGTNFSSNLDREEYKIFKEFLKTAEMSSKEYYWGR